MSGLNSGSLTSRSKHEVYATREMNSTRTSFLLLGVELWNKEEKVIVQIKIWTSISELRNENLPEGTEGEEWMG